MRVGLIDGLRKEIGKGIDYLENLGRNGQADNAILKLVRSLRSNLSITTAPRDLFEMLQSMREILHRELGEDSKGMGFKVKMPDGQVQEFNTLEEFDEEASKHAPPAHEISRQREGAPRRRRKVMKSIR